MSTSTIQRASPRFPIYIPSKGRWETRHTARALEAMRVPYRIVVEEQERAAYEAVIDPRKVLVLDPAYQRAYDVFDALGDSKPKGSGPARNFIWDHALASGSERHWIMDDNIKSFHRFNKNLKVPVSDGTIFGCMEDFVERYGNVAMAGPNYFMFISRKNTHPPMTLNTRIYSCNLIRNDLPYRWRGRFNEDTDLSLRLLKAGWCTVLFNAFLQYKLPTLTVRGGNTDSIYREGTLPKSEMVVAMHPDVARLVWRFHRWHHIVDYSPFRYNRLARLGEPTPVGIDNYGMNFYALAGPTAPLQGA
jgi:hypothetical protein